MIYLCKTSSKTCTRNRSGCLKENFRAGTVYFYLGPIYFKANPRKLIIPAGSVKDLCCKRHLLCIRNVESFPVLNVVSVAHHVAAVLARHEFTVVASQGNGPVGVCNPFKALPFACGIPAAAHGFVSVLGRAVLSCALEGDSAVAGVLDVEFLPVLRCRRYNQLRRVLLFRSH